MSASDNFTDEQKRGFMLIDRVFREQANIQMALKSYGRQREQLSAIGLYPHGLLQHIEETLKLAAHRLSFLEMVVLGLSEQDRRDLADYAKFVRAKRDIEELDIHELRELLR